VLIPDSHAQRRGARADRQRLLAQLSRQVKGLHRRLLARQAQGVLGHLRLDRCAHGGCGSEEPIGGRQSRKRLMRPVEVVVLYEQVHPPLTVLEVSEHGAREQLLPQRLPEPLDLPAGLRMMRPALYVLDAVTLQLRFELGRAAPGRVLAALIGQDLPRRSVLGDAAAQCLEHQHASLVMRDRKTHQIPGVIVQERRNIQPLVPAKQEREQIRLPQLVRLRPLEVLHLHLAPYPSLCRLRLDAFGLQHPAHGRRRHADTQKSPHQVPDAPASGTRAGRMRRQDRLRTLIGRLLQVRMQNGLARLEGSLATLPVRLHPLHRSRVWHA